MISETSIKLEFRITAIVVSVLEKYEEEYIVEWQMLTDKSIKSIHREVDENMTTIILTKINKYLNTI